MKLLYLSIVLGTFSPLKLEIPIVLVWNFSCIILWYNTSFFFFPIFPLGNSYSKMLKLVIWSNPFFTFSPTTLLQLLPVNLLSRKFAWHDLLHLWIILFLTMSLISKISFSFSDCFFFHRIYLLFHGCPIVSHFSEDTIGV